MSRIVLEFAVGWDKRQGYHAELMNPTSTAEPDGGAQARTARTPLTPEDWLRTAEDVLVDKSVDGIRVDVLAKTMQVTRGSFYWHFADRDDLLARLLERWRQRQTERVIAAHARQGIAAQDVVGDLVRLPSRSAAAQRGGAIELAIRAWARRDERARRVVDEVDALRLQYMAQVFAQLGLDAATARHRAFLLYGYMQAESLFCVAGDAAEQAARRAYVEQLLAPTAISSAPIQP